MAHFVTLYEAKTPLSGLVDRAAAGEEIVIAKTASRRRSWYRSRRAANRASPPTPCASVASPPILPIDVENAGGPSWQHNDPFDRMLVAQARCLTFALASADVTVRAYPNVGGVTRVRGQCRDHAATACDHVSKWLAPKFAG